MQEPEQHPPSEQKPRYLIKSSPLVAGGKARLLSAKKVDPKPAKPREVSALEAHGYTDQAHKGLKGEPECVGATIHRVVAKVDAGAILTQVRPEPHISDNAHEGCGVRYSSGTNIIESFPADHGHPPVRPTGRRAQ